MSGFGWSSEWGHGFLGLVLNSQLDYSKLGSHGCREARESEIGLMRVYNVWAPFLLDQMSQHLRARHLPVTFSGQSAMTNNDVVLASCDPLLNDLPFTLRIIILLNLLRIIISLLGVLSVYLGTIM